MPDQERDTADSLERRVRSLEESVRVLTEELARLRGRSADAAASAQTLAPPAPRSSFSVPDELKPGHWLPPQMDFESLVGRYGTLVLSTVSGLAAVGLFLNWAIEKGFLGPQQRLGLGLITAAALAVAGMRLRRTERSFGASLLGLALAVTHVCAWGAGPALGLVPAWAAFLLAAVASIALAVFARAEEDEPLWSVGFSGAAIAPFVTGTGRENLPLLAAYGVAVLSSAAYAMNGRRWIVAGRVFLLASSAYTLALATGFERHYGPLLAMALPMAVALLGVLPWTRGWARRERLRALGVLAVFAAIRSGLGQDPPLERPVMAALIIGAGLLWLVLVDRSHAVGEPVPENQRYLHEGDWLDAAVLPLGFALAALAVLDASATNSGWVMACASGVLLLTVMRAPPGSLRDGAAFATFLCALVAELLLFRGRGTAFVGSLATLSAAGFAANRVWRSGAWTTLGLFGLAGAALIAFVHLAERAAYEYPPFLTTPSAEAAVVAAAILASMRFAAGSRRLEQWLRGGALVWAFLWVHQEIAFAINPTTAILLRVTYYAVAAVAAIGVGRARQVPLLRHAGLVLAIAAAATALYGAREIESVGARIGADLVAAAFLLAIAYWYRKRGGTRRPVLRTES